MTSTIDIRPARDRKAPPDAAVRTIVIGSPAQLPAAARRIAEAIGTDGVCIVEPWTADYDVLTAIAGILGDGQAHARADANGICGEREPFLTSWKEFRNQYFGVTDDEHPPHTDGTFIDGALLDGDALVRIGPPMLMLLQCVRPAKHGGANLVIDTEPIFADLLENRPDLAKVLMTRGCMTICRDDQLALDFAVYDRISDWRFRVRFRFDSMTYIPSWSFDALREVHERYHVGSSAVIRLPLRERQILVVDNHRMLHAREAFEGEGRLIRRAWISDRPMRLRCAAATARHARALEPYTSYRIVPYDQFRTSRVPIETGIRASRPLVARWEALVAEAQREAAVRMGQAR